MLVKRPWEVKIRSLALAERWGNGEHMEPPRVLNAGEGGELGIWTSLGGSRGDWISWGQSPPQTCCDQGLAPEILQ